MNDLNHTAVQQHVNEAAQDAYAAAHAECIGLMEVIQARLDNADAPSDLTDWGDVGDMGRLAMQLREIVSPE